MNKDATAREGRLSSSAIVSLHSNFAEKQNNARLDEIENVDTQKSSTTAAGAKSVSSRLLTRS
jgi:hypothetical protein